MSHVYVQTGKSVGQAVGGPVRETCVVAFPKRDLDGLGGAEREGGAPQAAVGSGSRAIVSSRLRAAYIAAAWMRRALINQNSTPAELMKSA